MSLKRQSLKFRLILSYSLTAFIITSLAVIFLYYILTNLARKNDRDFLIGELQTIANIMTQEARENSIETDLKQEIILEPRSSNYHYFVRIINPNNTVMIETPHINQQITTTAFPKVNGFNILSDIVYFKHHHKQFSLMSMNINYKNKLHTIQIALNTSHTRALIAQYQQYLWFLLLINIFISILIASLVTQHGLKPLFKLNRLLNTLQSDQLHLQLDTNTWPIELKETITNLNNMLHRIDDSFLRLKEFSSDIAHELRTPLNNLMCQNEVTLGQPRTTIEYTNVIAATIEECRKMAHLIDNMLLIARSKNSHFTLKKSNVNLNDLLKDSITYLQMLAEDKHITIRISGEECTVNGDKNLLKRMFVNLIVNSITYSDPQQNIDIRLAHTHEGVNVFIQDSGFGIAEKDLPYIFDRFYRTDESRSKNYGGSGLGLAIVKSIIQLHHANIEIDSQLNKGTLITITFYK